MKIERYRGQWYAKIDGVKYPVVHHLDWDETTNFHKVTFIDHPKVPGYVRLLAQARAVVMQKTRRWDNPEKEAGFDQCCDGYVGIFDVSNIKYVNRVLTFNTTLRESLVAA